MNVFYWGFLSLCFGICFHFVERLLYKHVSLPVRLRKNWIRFLREIANGFHFSVFMYVG